MNGTIPKVVNRTMREPMKEKLHHYQRRVTWFTWNYVAELLFFLAKCADAMLDPAIRLYIYKSLCIIDYGYKVNCNDPAITLKPHQEEAIQTLAAYYISMYKLSVNLPSAALGLFCGAWSDKVGRKLPVLISCFGATIAALLALISTSKARYAIPLIMFSALVRGTCGKSNIISMALCSYVTDTTDISQRTTRMGYLLAMNYFGYFVGSTLLGSLLELSTIPVVFCVFIGINLLIVVVSVLFMREDTNKGYYEYRRQSLAPHSHAPLEENSAFTKDGRYKITQAEIQPDKVEDVGKDAVTCYECNALLQWKNVVDTVDVLLRKRTGQKRCYLILLCMIIFTNQTCKSGEVDITALYVQQSPISWPQAVYGYMLAADCACMGLSVSLLSPLLSNLLNLHDATIVLIGLAFKAVKLSTLGGATTTWAVFLAVIIGSPNALLISGSRSLVSKLVDPTDIGKIFALIAMAETISNLIGSLVFTNLYGVTYSVYPGLTYFIMAAMYVIMEFVLIWPAITMIQSDQEEDNEEIVLISRTTSQDSCFEEETIPQ